MVVKYPPGDSLCLYVSVQQSKQYQLGPAELNLCHCQTSPAESAPLARSCKVWSTQSSRSPGSFDNAPGISEPFSSYSSFLILGLCYQNPLPFSAGWLALPQEVSLIISPSLYAPSNIISKPQHNEIPHKAPHRNALW